MTRTTATLVMCARVIADGLAVEKTPRGHELFRREVELIRELCDRVEAMLVVIPRDVERSLQALEKQAWRDRLEPLDLSGVLAAVDTTFGYAGTATARFGA